MISYAQNAEDAVLARLFDRQPKGFWVDLGAGHPVLDSVTKHFSDRGWHGMNVEPSAEMFALLLERRLRDINVRAAVSDREGEAAFYEGPEHNRGASTLEPEIARAYEARGDSFVPTTVRTTRLTTLLEEHGVERIDFLKVDVEGHEPAILGDTDWNTVRPRVIVVEAVEPGTSTPNHERWEPFLVHAGYVCTLFDGLNRFYALGDDAEARTALSAPANVFDDVEPWRWVSQLEQAQAHIADLAHARNVAEEYAADLERALKIAKERSADLGRHGKADT